MGERGRVESGSVCCRSGQEEPAQCPFSHLHSPEKILVVVVWD